MSEKLQPHEFHRRLLWFMGADPWPEPDIATDVQTSVRGRYEDDLNEQAQRFGFENWVDAWHRFNPEETELDALLRVAYVPGSDGR